MKQKFLRIKVPDVQFDVPMPENTVMTAVAEQLATRGFLVFDQLLVTRQAILYIALYEMEVGEKPSGEIVNFTRPPEGFKPS